MRECTAVVLAAGEGKRMRSRLPKVLHPIGRLPMIAHVVGAMRAAEVDRIAVVIGPGHDAVRDAVAAAAPDAAKGRSSRKAPDQRRHASVQGPTSAATERPITTFVEKNSGTNATRTKSRVLALARRIG